MDVYSDCLLRSSSIMFSTLHLPHKYQHLVNAHLFCSGTNNLTICIKTPTDLSYFHSHSLCGSGGLLSLPHYHHVLVTKGHQEVELRVHRYAVDGGALYLAEALPHRGRPLQHLPRQRTR